MRVRIPLHWTALVFACSVAIAVRANEGTDCTSNLETQQVVSNSNYRLFSDRKPWSATRCDSDQTYRFEVRSGDSPASKTNPTNLTEDSELVGRKKYALGREISVEFSMLVERGEQITSGWTVLGQLHNSTDPGDTPTSPPFAQYLSSGGEFTVVTRTYPSQPLPRETIRTVQFRDPSFERGKWYDFQYRIKFDHLGGGYLKGWRDGNEFIDYRGAVGYPAREGVYFVFGIYRKQAPETLAVRFRNIRINYSDTKTE